MDEMVNVNEIQKRIETMVISLKGKLEETILDNQNTIKTVLNILAWIFVLFTIRGTFKCIHILICKNYTKKHKRNNRQNENIAMV